jgi:RNA polymerase sigma factor (sigma-70 family)
MEPMTDEQRALVEESVGRAKATAARYARLCSVNREDAESSAIWGVVQAARGFNPDRGGVWKRWAGLHMKGEIKDLIRGSRPKLRVHWPEGEPEANSPSGVDEILEELPEGNMRDICRLVYEDGLSQSAAGRELGFSEKHGCYLHEKAISILRERLAS